MLPQRGSRPRLAGGSRIDQGDAVKLPRGRRAGHRFPGPCL